MKRLLPFLLLLTACAKEEPPLYRMTGHVRCMECLAVATVNGTEMYRGKVFDSADLQQFCDEGDVVVLRATALAYTDSAVTVWLKLNGDPAGFEYDQPTDSLITVEVSTRVEE